MKEFEQKHQRGSGTPAFSHHTRSVQEQVARVEELTAALEEKNAALAKAHASQAALVTALRGGSAPPAADENGGPGRPQLAAAAAPAAERGGGEETAAELRAAFKADAAALKGDYERLADKLREVRPSSINRLLLSGRAG